MKFRYSAIAICTMVMMSLLAAGCATKPMGVSTSTPLGVSVDQRWPAAGSDSPSDQSF